MDLYPPGEINANEGDLIEFKRRWFKIFPYFHFAVCTVNAQADPQAIVDQNGGRITVGVDSPKLFFFTRIVEKTITSLGDEYGCRVNNLDEAASAMGLQPLEPDEIVERARGFLREDCVRYYNVATQNCEHFATKCRYEEAFSLQVRDCVTAPFTFVLTLCSAIRNVCYSLRRPVVYVLGRTIDEVRENEDQPDEVEQVL